ncbi:hypothetical protein DOTSEDRAFT_48793 [Dothistroma septosporum NZE10]|uniref:Uncharacterized protein n=1 Tax=Dothistroma septosporum (strain NZE10 / CBS 128990) TaxID=675120 RepID=M2WHL5_DOTSN|nr:hypothetical protein DOTSEDRAFT_48793 [Dothistroma septosporum NZE10]
MGLAAKAVAIEEDEDNVNADNKDYYKAEEAEEDEATTAKVELLFKFSYGLSFRVLYGTKTHTDIYKLYASRITSSFERYGQLSLVNNLLQDPDRDSIVFNKDNYLVLDIALADDNFISRLIKQWRYSNCYYSNFSKTCFFTRLDNPKDYYKLSNEIARSTLTTKLWKSRGKDKLNLYSASVSKQASSQIYNIKAIVWVKEYNLREGQYTKLKVGI